MKQEIEALKAENKAMSIEAEKTAGKQGGQAFTVDKETAKKLKKRELECQALWDTIKDLLAASKNSLYDVRLLPDLLAVRALDTKAKRKLKI